MPRWRWCWRRFKRGRPPAWLLLHSLPPIKEFIPQPTLNPQPVELNYAEYEVLRLIDYEGMTHEEAAKKMKTSRATIWRLVQSARRKVVRALTESRPIVIQPKGEIQQIKERKN